MEDETEEIIEASLKQSEIDRLRHQIQTEDKDNQNNVDKTKKPFWITEKYRPIMKVANFGGNDDIIVVERPYSSLQTGPAFDLQKLKFNTKNCLYYIYMYTYCIVCILIYN